MIRQLLLAGLAAMTLLACGGAMPTQESVPPEPAQPAPGYPGYAPGEAEPALGEGSQQGDLDEHEEDGRHDDSLSQALEAFEGASSELRAASSDCALACKALSSMARARDRICALTEAQDPARCRAATERHREAELRVSSQCTCPPSP